jgi:hemoglobin
MDELPEAYTVRRLHPDSLAGSADSLFKFLSGCFGRCTSASAATRGCACDMPLTRSDSAERDEWLLCMRQALEEQVADEALRAGVMRACRHGRSHDQRGRRPRCDRGLRWKLLMQIGGRLPADPVAVTEPVLHGIGVGVVTRAHRNATP